MSHRLPATRRYIVSMSATSAGHRYWAIQFGVAIAGLVLLPVFGIALSVSSREYRGLGVIVVLCAVPFVVLLVWVGRQYRAYPREQRLIYGWAVMQQTHPVWLVRARPQLRIMATARRARDGKMSRQELLWLQSLKPKNPYPGVLPPV